MSDELVSRLNGIYLEYEIHEVVASLCEVAADRIESQDREIAELKRRLARWESAPVWGYAVGKKTPRGNGYRVECTHTNDYEVALRIAENYGSDVFTLIARPTEE